MEFVILATSKSRPACSTYCHEPSFDPSFDHKLTSKQLAKWWLMGRIKGDKLQNGE